MRQRPDPRNTDILIGIDGEQIPRTEAGVSPFDSSVQNGDAVWEGLRLYAGGVFRLQAHLDRLRRSASALQYAAVPSDAELRDQLRATLRANGMRDGVHIRLMLTRGVKVTSGLDPRLNTNGCTVLVIAEHKPPVYDKSGISLITAAQRRPPPEVLNQHIHSANQVTSILAKLEATAAGADDALMLDTRGFVAETNATHLFMVRDGVLATPTTIACPEGITRSAVLDLCAAHAIPARVGDITRDEFAAADEAFCTGTMGEIAPILSLDGAPLGDTASATDGGAGPLTRRLAALFAELVPRECEPLLD